MYIYIYVYMYKLQIKEKMNEQKIQFTNAKFYFFKLSEKFAEEQKYKIFCKQR